jgi:hypothetical protein
VPAAKPTPTELLDLLVDRAPGLIAVGVTSISIDGLSATLARPPATPPAGAVTKPRAKQHVDPLLDPATYPGGRVPGYTREDERDRTYE